MSTQSLGVVLLPDAPGAGNERVRDGRDAADSALFPRDVREASPVSVCTQGCVFVFVYVCVCVCVAALKIVCKYGVSALKVCRLRVLTDNPVRRVRVKSHGQIRIYDRL